MGNNRDDSSSAIVREHLLTGAFGPQVERIEVHRVTLQPAQNAGLHFHPGGVVGYVVDGEIVFEIKGQPLTILRAGSAFYEPPDATISRFDNLSETAPATFIAFYPLTGDQALITYVQI